MSMEKQNQYDDDDLITDIDESDDLVNENDDFGSEQQEQNSEPKQEKKQSRFDKRINQLTYKLRTAEEIAQAAQLLAEKQAQRLAELENKFSTSDKNTIDAELQDLKKQKRVALEEMDFEKLDELDDKIYDLRRKKEQPIERSQEPERQQQPQTQSLQNKKLQSQIEYETENSDWIFEDGENYDPSRVVKANTIAERLVAAGYNPKDKKFWALVDANLNKQGRAMPSGESGGSQSQSRSSGNLTNADKELMRRFGGDPSNQEDVSLYLQTKQQQAGKK